MNTSNDFYSDKNYQLQLNNKLNRFKRDLSQLGDYSIEVHESRPLRVIPNFSAFATDLIELNQAPTNEDVLRASVIDATKRYFDAKGFNTDWEGIQDLGLTELVTSLGMACPFDPLEKQALLEAENVEERAKTLTQIMTMATLGDSVDATVAVN